MVTCRFNNCMASCCLLFRIVKHSKFNMWSVTNRAFSCFMQLQSSVFKRFYGVITVQELPHVYKPYKDERCFQILGRCFHCTSLKADRKSDSESKVTGSTTVKIKADNTNTLLDNVTSELHPNKSQHKARNVTMDELKEQLHSIHRLTYIRKKGDHKFPGRDQRMNRNDIENFQLKLNMVDEKSSVPQSQQINKEKVAEYVNILLNGKERLGIFDPEDFKEPRQADEEKLPYKTAIEWWEEWEAKAIHKIVSKHPKNQYHEMVDWTNEGKFPTFPIDNEVGMEEESKVPFHKHVFLHDLIMEGFPKSGPVRKFMEAVILGLSNNPYITVKEKEEHIDWFREYLKEKFELLKSLDIVDKTESLEHN